ncbi:MAG: class I SAM-dependent methyltransferase [Elainellaceae cyanobacterium]
MQLICPLCLTPEPAKVSGADDRHYYLCSHCSLIFVDPGHHLSLDEERAYYGTHHNSIEQEGYVNFLNRVVKPTLAYLDNTMRGLDYGCGPGPTLSELVKRQGIDCEDYDPIFLDAPLRSPYDFIFATECFEHFYNPRQDIHRIHSLLKPGGVLGIMTDRWVSLDHFATWHYTTDPTHTSFYHARTFEFLCDHLGFETLWSDETRVIILRRHE